MKKNYLIVKSFVFVCIVMIADTASAQTPFDRMDRNGDGQLSRQEFRGPLRGFKRMDRNRDGYVTFQEAEGTPLVGGKRRSPSRSKNKGKSGNVPLTVVDTHNHLVGRVSGGSNRQFDYANPARTALDIMDAAGVKVNLVMPMPQDDEQKNRLYLDDILPVVTKYPGRFAVLGGGGSLNVIIQETITAGRVTDGDRKKFDATAEELIRKGIVGFGEMTAEHFSMKADHHYESAPPDHPLFLRLADLAAQYDVPIDIHMEAIPEEMKLPSRLKSPPNPQVLKPNIAGFERLLAHNRNAQIIRVHLGWDNTGKRTVGLTRKLMSKHPNLYMSIRVAGGMQARNVVSSTFPLDSQGYLKQDWLKLFHEFPNRFVIGSDEIILQSKGNSSRGNRHPSAGSIEATVGLLQQLPDELRRKVGHENATHLFKLKP